MKLVWESSKYAQIPKQVVHPKHGTKDHERVVFNNNSKLGRLFRVRLRRFKRQGISAEYNPNHAPPDLFKLSGLQNSDNREDEAVDVGHVDDN